MQKLSGRLRVSSENYYLPLPPGPLDTKSVISRPVPIVVLLSGGPLSTAGSQHSNPGLTAAPQLSCRLGVNFKLNHCGLMLNRLDGSGSASTTRLYQVGSTSPAWAASKTQAGPCHFRRRVKSANSLRLGLGVGTSIPKKTKKNPLLTKMLPQLTKNRPNLTKTRSKIRFSSILF
jgi:hypothetical protein